MNYYTIHADIFMAFSLDRVVYLSLQSSIHIIQSVGPEELCPLPIAIVGSQLARMETLLRSIL